MRQLENQQREYEEVSKNKGRNVEIYMHLQRMGE